MTTLLGPPRLFVLCIGSMVALHALLPVARLVPPPWTLAGLALSVPGLAGALWAVRHLRLFRNPVYLGYVLGLAGLWVLLGTASPGVAVAGFAVVADWVWIRGEERALRRAFGEAYDAWTAETRRWL